MLTEEQITYLKSIKYINVIDEKVKVLSEFDIKYLPAAPNIVGKVILILNVFYNNDKITELSFDLQNYNYDELIEIGQNIKKNDFIMYELDTHLAGDIE